MKVTAVNTSPRGNWNTAQMVRAACEGAKHCGAEVSYYDLYRQEKFTGCISCFGCKIPGRQGSCICNDGLKPILQSIAESDVVILGTPNYLGEPSAGFRALFERLIFQNLTYEKERRCYHAPEKRVLFLMSSNAPEEYYDAIGYTDMITRLKGSLDTFVGKTETYICGNTLQVADYSRYTWTYFDPESKKQRHETVFPNQLEEIRAIAENMCK